MATEVRVTGIEEIVRKLNALPDKIHRKVLRHTIDELTAKVDSELQAAAPIGHRTYLATHKSKKTGKTTATQHPGFLRRSIKQIEARKVKDTIRARIFGVFYARFLERGTRYMDARPFIQPLVDNQVSELLQQFVTKIAKEVENVAPK